MALFLVFGQVAADLGEVVAGGLAGSFFPGEDAYGGDAVEAGLGEGGEEDVPVHVALADIEVLVDPGRRAGRVHDVAQARRGPAYLMICSMSPPWWNVCGAQYRNDTQSLSMPRTRSTPARPSSTKSSGCGSSTSRIPSRSKTGASSSSERQNWASLAAGASGRPLNSEFITVAPRSTVIWMARFQ